MALSILGKLCKEHGKTTSLCLLTLLVARLTIDQVFRSTRTQLPSGSETQAPLQPRDRDSFSSRRRSQRDAAQLLRALPLRAQDSSFCNNCAVTPTQRLSLKLSKGNVTSSSNILCSTKS